MGSIYSSILFGLTIFIGIQAYAGPVSNRVFKELHSLLEDGQKEQALYHLRNHSRELVGTDNLLAKYAQGVLGAELGQYKQAETELNNAEGLKELMPYIEYYKGLIDFETGEVKKAEAHLKNSLKEKKIQSDLKEKIDHLYGLIHLKKRRGTEAYKKLNPLLRSWRGSPKRAELLVDLLDASVGKRLFSRGRYCKWFRDLYVDHPSNKYSNEWGFKSEELKFDGRKIDCSVSLRHMRSKLRRYYLEGLTGDILSNLEKIKKQRYIHNSLLASYYYYTGQPKKSLALLGNNQQDDKGKSYNERRRLARISYYAGNPEKALYIYKDLYESETNQRRKERLLFDMGELNLELSNFKTAEIYFKNYLASYPWSRKAREVHWLLPWTLYLGGKHQEAYDGFLSLADKIKKRPNRYRRIDDKQVYYWAARALQKSGQEKRAALIYQQISSDPLVSYYAILSSLRLEELASKNQVLLSSKDFLKIPWIDKSKRVLGLKERFLDSFKLSSRMPSALHVGNNSYGVPIVDLDESYPKKKVKIKPVEESTYSDYLMRYTYFSRLGFWSDASEELVLVKRLAKTKELKKKLLNYFESTEDYSNSSRLASMSFYRERHYSKPEVAFEYWSKAYPKAYEEHVDGASALFGVSKNLIWGIMRAESFFDTKIMSPVGARGLLQVMPYTGAKILSILSGRDPLSDVITSDHQLHISKSLLEAKTNIRYGAKYMSRLSKQFDGHLPFVAAGYNGGPHRVKMWSKIMGDVAQDEFTERIPFNETRKYVKKVMRNMYVYSSLYDEPMDMSYLIKPTAYVEKGPIPTSEYWGKL